MKIRRLDALHLAVQFADEKAAWLPDRQQVRRWVRAALDAISPERASVLTLRFASASEAKALNRAHLQRAYAPNVLTFNLHDDSESPSTDPVTSDIVICMQTVAAEARAQGKALREHCAHMVVHGVLHAHGFDHREPQQATLMEAIERSVLRRFQISDPYEPR